VRSLKASSRLDDSARSSSGTPDRRDASRTSRLPGVGTARDIDGIDGARTWCGWGILAHNATKIALLINERETKRPRSFAEESIDDHHETIRASATDTADDSRVISPRSSLVAPPKPETAQDGVKSDRRGRGEAR
jgi:hypothetical protein